MRDFKDEIKAFAFFVIISSGIAFMIIFSNIKGY